MTAPSDPDHAIKMPVDASNNPQDEAVNLLRGLAQRMENMEQEIQRQKAETAARDQIEQMSQSSGQSSLAHWVKPKPAEPGL
jgi:protein-arginine kinase activator protein McsA